MAFEDIFEGGLSSGIVLGAIGAALLSRSSPPLHAALKATVALFLEAEFEAEGDIIDKLVAETIGSLVEITSQKLSASERRKAARTQIEKFGRTARSRARRHGWSERDKATRYRRHTKRLKHGLATTRSNHSETQEPLLAQFSDILVEDW